MWEWFIGFLTSILEQLAQLTGDWGVAIIILTVILRILVLPILNKSTAASAQMKVLQPKLQELQQRYGHDKARLDEEMRKFYAEHKFNPLGGCLPILLQAPVFFGLFTVCRDIPQTAHFYNILPSLSTSAAQVFSEGNLITSSVYILFVALFGLLSVIPIILMNNNADANRQPTIAIGLIMAAMMLWFGWTVPAGVLLYYDTSALWQVIQTKIITQRVMEKANAEAAAQLKNEGPKLDVVLKERKPRPKKKS